MILRLDRFVAECNQIDSNWTIVIDGLNIAYQAKKFSHLAFYEVVNWFTVNGNKHIIVVLPSYHKETAVFNWPELHRANQLHFVESIVGDQADDIYAVDLAHRHSGLLVTNDLLDTVRSQLTHEQYEYAIGHRIGFKFEHTLMLVDFPDDRFVMPGKRPSPTDPKRLKYLAQTSIQEKLASAVARYPAYYHYQLPAVWTGPIDEHYIDCL